MIKAAFTTRLEPSPYYGKVSTYRVQTCGSKVFAALCFSRALKSKRQKATTRFLSLKFRLRKGDGVGSV